MCFGCYLRRGIAEIAKKYRVLFIEEATANFNPELYRVIAQSTFIPLSAGERVHTRWEFYQLLRHNAVSVIQPDICNTGGLSEAKKICDLAQLFDVRVQAHVAGTPLTGGGRHAPGSSHSQFLLS